MKTMMRCLVMVFFIVTNSNGQWVQTNGPCGGIVYSLAVSGTNLFAGTGDGVFLSTNNGTNWTTVNNGLSKRGTKLAVSPNGTGGTNLFAGYTRGYEIPAPSGIFLSTNNGTSWSAVNTPFEGFSQMVEIGTNLFAGNEDGGVFLSTNNGTSWTAVNTGMTNTKVFSLAVSGTNLFAGTFGGVFLSTNNGASWTAVNTGLTSSFVFALYVSGTNLLAGTGGGGVFLSTNNGTNWTAISNNLPTNCEIHALAVSPNGTGGTNLFAGYMRDYESGVFLSTNNGTSWTAVNTGLIKNTWVHALVVSPNGTGRGLDSSSGMNLFAATTGGVFRSTNNGANWTVIGIPVSHVRALAVSGANVISCVREKEDPLNNGVFLSTNNGTSWSAADTTLLDFSEMVEIGTNLFAGNYGSGVFLSTNNGTSWSSVNSGLTNKLINSLAVSGTNLFAGTEGGGVFLSTNNGTSWSGASNGLPNTSVWSLAVSGTNLFAGTDGGVFLSTNNGTSWSAVNTPFSLFSQMVEIGTSLFAGTSSGVFLSTNNGASWTAASTGLPTYNAIRALAFSGNYLFAGTSGVFLSTNNGTSWTAVNNGLTNTGVRCLAVSGTNLFAGTDGDGVWRRPLSEMITDVQQTTTQLLEKYSLSQNYPNPFNPSTTISYSIPERSNVRLSIFNTLGQNISEMVNEVRDAGSYEQSFDASQLSSGIYFYRIEAASVSNSKTFVETKKMVLMK
jgi:hypothetical protein